MQVHYQIEFDDYRQHLIHVTLRFLASPNQLLWLPTWIPGSYLIREFSKHIEQVKAYDEAGHSLKISKKTKNQWQLFNTDHELMTVEYDVYAYDLSVRGAYVDDTRLYVNPACVCMAVAGQEQDPCEVALFIPKALQHFTLVTGLKSHQFMQGRFTLTSQNYDQLIDSPFELAEHSRFEFNIKDGERDICHQFVISGKHQANLSRLQQDITKICQAEVDLFGSAPFDDYTFMTMATGNHYGGLEHTNSTSLITPRQDLPKIDEPDEPSADYQRYLGLCSHEYFHAWWVKFIRPESFVNYPLHQEGYTTLLWIFEGFTSYYDDLILYRSGVISQASYFKLLTAQINRYLQNDGRKIQSVSESSFDAWIKYYRQDENSNQAGTSYYNKGALVALCLDLSLRLHSSSLDAVLGQFYLNAQQAKQVNEHTIFEVCQQLTGQDWRERIQYLIDTTEELPLEQLLASFGIDYKILEKSALPFGLKLQEKPEGLLIQTAQRQGVASQAGLSAHDIIVAIDGLKATTALCTQLSKEKTTRSVKVHAFRRDELMEFDMPLGEHQLQDVELSIKDESLVAKWLSR
ncbi:M61 family metallopeptidase [Moraxella sp. ZY210820]|uniref:M61 family metallopeptidase n=1 Tax=unclassified Moraxella TaxID=2685852 RepID=UPI00272FCF2C|nr:M61 family peptidase [Moraxella sp. ZY210820]WLF84289.1 M61 family peptidase [Moraxella sp. ZY210820]